MVKIIAEFCQNHNGNYNLLQEMIHQAFEAGATYGKIQTIFADDLSFREKFEKGEIKNGDCLVIKRPYQNEYDRLKKLELTYGQQEKFISECKRYGLKPLTTCFTKNQIPRINNFELDTIKVASYDCSALPFISELERNFQNLIISTGATFDHEIELTANYLNQNGCNFIFLHCVTIYPTPLKSVHLNRMKYLKKFTKKVGFSDHTNSIIDGVKASIAAVYCGAEYIERHFRILGPEDSKDGLVSINSRQLREIVDFSMMSKTEQKTYINDLVPEYNLMKGKTKRDLSKEEMLNRDYYRGRFASKIEGKTVFNWDE